MRTEPYRPFDEPYYLRSKTAQLNKSGQAAPDGGLWTVEQTARAMAEAGLTPAGHYLAYGRDEGLNPNAWFNEYEYLLAKTAQLNSVREVKPGEAAFSAWTVAETLAAILDAGLIPAEHYERHGAFETDAEGNRINPSNAFDADAYLAAKFALLAQEEPGAYTWESMLAAFQEAGLSPVSHYMAYGAEEAAASATSLVRTVPVNLRVADDPGRATTGDILPDDEAGGASEPPDDGGGGSGGISGGKGVDTLVPGHDGLLIRQNAGDSGVFTLPDSGETVSTALFDRADCSAVSAVSFQIGGYKAADWTGGVGVAPSFSAVTLEDNAARLVQGTYNAKAKTFTADASGNDGLLAYDSDASANIQYEAVVIVGLHTAVTDSAGLLDIT